MIKLIKGAVVYSPKYLGVKDILIIDSKVYAIEKNIDLHNLSILNVEIIDANGKVAVPGFIDSHVHILGGGGEGGFKTRTPEIQLSDIIAGGITTVIGCLGTDGITRSMEALLAKANGLEEEGIATYIYTGNYRVPVVTITGDIMKDMLVVDKIIGVGELAISDHRSSQPTIDELKRIAADARVGGILSGKSGIINVHVGSGKRKLRPLFEIADSTEIPITQFLPTHINRSKELFEDGIKFAKSGGHIDFTTSSNPTVKKDRELTASWCLKRCLDEGIPIERISFSSDGQGSLPMFNDKKEFIGLGIGKVSSLFNEMRNAVIKDNIPLDVALSTVTTNPAETLKLKRKGKIEKDFDADIVLLDGGSLEIDTVIARGKIMAINRELKVKGTFE